MYYMSDVPGTAAPQASQTPTQESTESQVEDSQELSGDEGSAEIQAEISDLKEQAATGTPKEKAEAKKMLKSLKIKFNGREFEEKLPFEIPDDETSREFMTRHLQMSKLSQSKAQEYSALEKEVQQFVEQVRKNPRKALSDPTLNLDLKKLAAEIIEEEIANSEKTPEQLKAEKLEAELKAIKEEREAEKEESKKREFERLQAQEFERYETLMVQALDGSKLPKSPYIVKKIADYMLLGLQAGHDVTPQDVLPLVEQEMHADLKEMFAAMPDEVVEALVGKDVFNRVRKKNIAKAKSTQQPPVPLKAAVKDVGAKGDSKEPKVKETFKSFFKT